MPDKSITLGTKRSLERSIIVLFLPEGILEYFDVTSVEKTEEITSKVYYDKIAVSDFPIQGLLSDSQRRRKMISRDWQLVTIFSFKSAK